MTREWRLRTRWTGTCVPERGPPRPEPWAVYVLEGRWQWTVVGRLLERPWCRVGGGGEMADSDGPATPQALEWLERQGLTGESVWFPMGSLVLPDRVCASDLKPWRPPPTRWAPRHRFDSLGAARAAGQRMADVLCPRGQERRDRDRRTRRAA